MSFKTKINNYYFGFKKIVINEIRKKINKKVYSLTDFVVGNIPITKICVENNKVSIYSNENLIDIKLFSIDELWEICYKL
jgi:hypothetical protein